MPSATTPADIDTLLHDRHADLDEWLASHEDGPLKVIRTFHVALLNDDRKTLQDLMPQLPDLAPAPGLRLLGLAQLEDYDAVLQHPPVPSGASLPELECAVHGFTAYGIACTERGRFSEAALAARTAMAFATALGMTQRAQMLELEAERVQTLSGEPSPDAIQRHLMRPMPDLRRKWGQRNLAESYMALGCYGLALRSIGLPSQDGPDDAALREYLHVVLRLPASRPATDPLLAGNAPYWRLAQASRGLFDKFKAPPLDGITCEPESTYALMLKATVLLMAPKMIQHGVTLLESARTLQADHRLYSLLLLLTAHLRGARVSNAAGLPFRITEAINRLRPDNDLVAHLFLLFPIAMLALRFGPRAHPLVVQADLSNIPLLTGKAIQYGAGEAPTPGKTGTRAVLNALGLPQVPETREETRRFKAAQEELPYLAVNLGDVVAACTAMVQAARAAGKPTLSLEWQASRKEVMKMLSEDVLSLLPDDSKAD